MTKRIPSPLILTPRRQSSVDRTIPGSQIVVDRILRGIQEGRYAPGQRLIATDLAKALGLSRAPVREALQRLAGEGVVSLTPNRGATIRRLAERDVVHMLVLLEAIGALGIELAVPMLTSLQQRRIFQRAIDELMKVAEARNPLRWINALVEFHSQVNELSQNVYLNLAMKSLHVQYHNRVISQVLPGRHWSEYVSHYRELGEAMLGGDGVRAARLFRAHMRWVIEAFTAEMHGRAVSA